MGRTTSVAAYLTVIGIVAGRLLTAGGGAATTAPRAAPEVTVAPAGSDNLAQLEATLTKNPNDLTTLQTLAVDYVRRAAYGDPSYYDLARRALARAFKVSPGNDVTFVAKGVLELSLHQFGEALAIGQRVHRDNPNLDDDYAVLVDASVELGHYRDAQRYIQELVDRHPGLPAYARVSYFRELHGDDNGAVSAMQLAIAAGAGVPSDVGSVTELLGDVQFARGDLRDAGSDYTQALRLIPNLPLAELGLAKVEAAQGKVLAAVDRLTKLTNVYPLPQAVGVLGDLQMRLGRTADAQQSYALVGAIASLQHRSGQVTDLEMAQFQLDHGQIALGTSTADAAYKARPDNVYVDDVMAWARYRHGDFRGAQHYEIQALRIDGSDAMLHYHEATIEAALGDRTAATAQLRFALHENPWFSFAIRNQIAHLAESLGVPFAAW
ncbi:MAG TPA: tetratricopeptide repeat protein [Acidimicrobiia bacterium]|jgi:tetratricopeptide (TPR) repeat protein